MRTRKARNVAHKKSGVRAALDYSSVVTHALLQSLYHKSYTELSCHGSFALDNSLVGFDAWRLLQFRSQPSHRAEVAHAGGGFGEAEDFGDFAVREMLEVAEQDHLAVLLVHCVEGLLK